VNFRSWSVNTIHLHSANSWLTWTGHRSDTGNYAASVCFSRPRRGFGHLLGRAHLAKPPLRVANTLLDGVGGTFFSSNSTDDMFAIVMMQSPSSAAGFRTEVKTLIYQAIGE